jgi:hypothetical protein
MSAESLRLAGTVWNPSPVAVSMLPSDASALSHTHPKRNLTPRSKINKKDKEKKTPCPWPASQQDSPPPQENPPLPAMRIRGRRRDADGNPSLPTPLQYFDYQPKPPPSPPTDGRPEPPDAQQDDSSTAFREHIAPSSPRSSPPTASPPSSCRSYSFSPYTGSRPSPSHFSWSRDLVPADPLDLLPQILRRMRGRRSWREGAVRAALGYPQGAPWADI